MPKNIVICLDGTGQQPGQACISNVARLFRALERKSGEQIAYYDPGVGTMGDPSYKTWIARKINKLLGLAFGRGLTKNILEAYTYLMEHYEDGARIFLFGFSRGAYTARVLSEFIKECGLLEKGAHNLVLYAMRLFKKRAPWSEKASEKFRKVRETFRHDFAREPQIEFLGLFDTVKSYGWVRNPMTLGDENENSQVVTVRHALAIDERRRFYRQMHWISSPRQDCKEVWFAGSHMDVGGGYPEDESARVAFEWMVEEARWQGLDVAEDSYRSYAPAREERKAASVFEKYGRLHESLRGLWWLVQLIPRPREVWEEHGWRRTIKGEKDRNPTHRSPQPLWVHQSVVARLEDDSEYRPLSLLGPRDSKWFAEARTVRAALPEGCEIEQTVGGGDPQDNTAGLQGVPGALRRRLRELKRRIEILASDADLLAEKAVTRDEAQSIAEGVVEKGGLEGRITALGHRLTQEAARLVSKDAALQTAISALGPGLSEKRVKQVVEELIAQAVPETLRPDLGELKTQIKKLAGDADLLAEKAVTRDEAKVIAVGVVEERELEAKIQAVTGELGRIAGCVDELPRYQGDREDIRAELIAADLYEAVLRRRPSEDELRALKAEFKGKAPVDLEEAVKRLVEDHWTVVETAASKLRKTLEPEKALPWGKPGEWKLLRDQLWQGLLKRRFSSWDYTETDDKALKKLKKDADHRKENFIKIALNLLESPEYATRLEHRIGSRLASDWILAQQKQAPTKP